MKKIFLFVTIVLLVFSVKLSAQQEADVHLDLLVEDLVGGSNILTFGLDSIATDGIDVLLGEGDLPPVPPSGAFDARFLLPPYPGGTLASWMDFRQPVPLANPATDTIQYRLRYQASSGATVMKFSWDLPAQATGLLRDIFGGVLINQPMSGTGSYTLTNLGIDQLDMFIYYIEIPLPVELTSFGAVISGNTVTLKWQTSTEVNNRGFEIERKAGSSQSAAGNWEKIGYVTGSGTTSEIKSYSFTDDNVSAGKYTYRLKQIDFDGTFKYSDEVEADLSVSEYKLNQNYPNPFNPSTAVSFAVPQEGFVAVKVYNMIGQEVVTLFSGNSKPGVYTLDWNGKDNYGNNVSSGSYICKMTAGSFTESKKMILIK